jgi:CheY-like chemotaxis protein
MMAKTKILIIDDDQDIRDSVQAILEGRQYKVVTAADRDEGMDKIESEKPDLIILDVMMMTSWQGFEMAREIKKNPKYKEIPILMMTGVKEQTGLDFKSSAGDPTWCPVQGFLDKPVEPDILIAEVERLLSEKE